MSGNLLAHISVRVWGAFNFKHFPLRKKMKKKFQNHTTTASGRKNIVEEERKKERKKKAENSELPKLIYCYMSRIRAALRGGFSEFLDKTNVVLL